MDMITYGSILEDRLALRRCRQTSDWTDARVCKLREMHAAKAYYGDIAKELGVTRNAVCGKVKRLGLSIPHHERVYPKRDKATRAPRVRVERQAKVRSGRMTLFDLFPVVDISQDLTLRTELSCDVVGLSQDNCHWPVGEPGTEGFFFCGQEAVKGRPYCGAHCRVAYTKVPPKGRPRFVSHSGTHRVGAV